MLKPQAKRKGWEGSRQERLVDLSGPLDPFADFALFQWVS
jgi:hypothetical protein